MASTRDRAVPLRANPPRSRSTKINAVCFQGAGFWRWNVGLSRRGKYVAPTNQTKRNQPDQRQKTRSPNPCDASHRARSEHVDNLRQLKAR